VNDDGQYYASLFLLLVIVAGFVGAKKLETSALTTSPIPSRTKRDVHEIVVPKDTAEILIAKAMKGFK